MYSTVSLVPLITGLPTITFGFIENQAEYPLPSGGGMNAVRFRINQYFRATLISSIFSAIHWQISMKSAYKFRMYPTGQQEAQLDLTLETCRHLYNLALADRKNAYEVEGISRTYEDQAAMLTIEKKDSISRESSLKCFRMS